MASYSKVNMITGEYSSPAVTETDYVISIDPQTLGIPDGNDIIPASGSNRNGAYILDIRSLNIGGTTTSDGAMFLRVGVGILDATSATNPRVLPAPTGQGVATEQLVLNDSNIIRVVGHTSQWDGTDGAAPAGIVNGNINVCFRTYAGITTASKHKIYIDIHGFGDDSL